MSEKTDTKRIEELEERVAALEDKLSRGEQRSTDTAQNRLLDRYDTYVVENAEGDTRPTTARMRTLYQEAGIVDKNKIKQRMKRLDKLGVWGE